MTAFLDICESIDGPSPEWYREAAAEWTPPPSSTETPDMTGYSYGGNGRSLTQAEAQRRLTSRPQLATSQQARAATPAPAIVAGTVVHDQADKAAPALKGAVKVDAFPERSKYPFRQIAEDGGVWRLDPAAYKSKTGAIGVAAGKWARDHGYTVKIMNDDGMTYLQFTPEAS